jgi:hypothetical protein
MDGWVPTWIERVYAILDNLNVHHCDDVLLFCLTHPRWEFVFQPTYAAYLNLIEPWWKILRSLAFKGSRFETWEEMAAAAHAATAYLLERPPASLRLGPQAPPLPAAALRYWPHAKGGLK